MPDCEEDLDTVVGAILWRMVLPDPGRIVRGHRRAEVSALVLPSGCGGNELNRDVLHEHVVPTLDGAATTDSSWQGYL